MVCVFPDLSVFIFTTIPGLGGWGKGVKEMAGGGVNRLLSESVPLHNLETVTCFTGLLQCGIKMRQKTS